MLSVSFVEATFRIPDGDLPEDYTADSVIDERLLTFREVVLLMRHEYQHPSCWPASGTAHEWLNAETVTDWRDGTYTERSMHFDRSNPQRRAKYWRLAMKAAGVTK
jgi:hypothetical protein